jgi:hypothetical protein
MAPQDTNKLMPSNGATALRLAWTTTVLVLIGVVALQWHAASLLLGSSLQGDEAKHFTSGVMVYDYLRSGFTLKPIPFAEQFEVRYPLVAIGQWPPMYYAIQAVFYFVAGPFIRSAQVLSALMAVALASLIFLGLKADVGVRVALIAAGVFLAAPLMQGAAWQVMSDLLTGLFVYLAIAAFAKVLDAPGNKMSALAFAAYAVAAILSKGSAWALAPFFLFAPILSRRAGFFRSRWFMGAIVIVVLFGSAFYLFAARLGIGYPMFLPYFLSLGIKARWLTVEQVLAFAPASMLVIGVIGALIAIHARWWLNDHTHRTSLSLVATAWVASQIVFLAILPMTREPRVMLPALAPLAVLAAGTMRSLQRMVRQEPVLAAVVPAILGGIILAGSLSAGTYRVDGFRRAADAMPYPSDGALILVATNKWGGEEELISERLSHDRAHKDVILRGSHVLADLSLEEMGEEPLFDSADAVRNYLLQMPVRFVVLSSPPYQYSFQALIDAAVAGDPQDFRLVAQVPIVVRPSGTILHELRIYENPAGRDHHPDVVQTRLGSIGGRRILEYRWK